MSVNLATLKPTIEDGPLRRCPCRTIICLKKSSFDSTTIMMSYIMTCPSGLGPYLSQGNCIRILWKKWNVFGGHKWIHIDSDQMYSYSAVQKLKVHLFGFREISTSANVDYTNFSVKRAIYLGESCLISPWLLPRQCNKLHTGIWWMASFNNLS